MLFIFALLYSMCNALLFWINYINCRVWKSNFYICAKNVQLKYFASDGMNHKQKQIVFQVLGKSVKPIPVMILGILLARKRYPAAKFLFILMICMGVAMFMFKDKKPGDMSEEHGFGFGEVLLVGGCCVRLIKLQYSLTWVSGHLY